MRNLISAIGAGINIYKNIKNPRYGKIVIAADSDPDGASIASLVLGVIAYHMTFLIEEGMVYIADSPLYYQNGRYLFPSDGNVEELLDRTKPYTRFKGLGELNTSQAKDIFFNENTRRLIQVTTEGMQDALNVLTSTYTRKLMMIERGVLKEIYEPNS